MCTFQSPKKTMHVVANPTRNTRPLSLTVLSMGSATHYVMGPHESGGNSSKMEAALPLSSTSFVILKTYTLAVGFERFPGIRDLTSLVHSREWRLSWVTHVA